MGSSNARYISPDLYIDDPLSFYYFQERKENEDLHHEEIEEMSQRKQDRYFESNDPASYNSNDHVSPTVIMSNRNKKIEKIEEFYENYTQELEINDNVSILDKNHVWRIGTIIDIGDPENKDLDEIAVLVTYQDNNDVELIKSNKRLALLDDLTSKSLSSSYAVDQYLEVLDTRREKNDWRLALIMEVKTKKILIHYYHDSNYYNEWIDLSKEDYKIRPAFGADIVKEEHEKSLALTAVKSLGLTLIECSSDGNCLFRSVSAQIFGINALHHRVRKEVTDYMIDNKAFFSSFIVGDFEMYISEKKRDNCWGDHLEILAVEELYDREVVIYSAESSDTLIPINTCRNRIEGREVNPILLSFHGKNHYNALVDNKFPIPFRYLNTKFIRNQRIEKTSKKEG